MAVSSAACGDDARPADARADASVDAAPPTPSVDIPWLESGVPPITLTPCPSGWREVPSEHGITTCDPYPTDGPLDCGPGEGHFHGEDACRPVGDPCPAGQFAASLPTDGTVIYVDPDATPGGDGSLAQPLTAISEVRWSSLAAGTTVALAKGTHAGTLPLKAGVRVVGACAAETVITGVDAPVQGVVFVTNGGEGALVRNVSIVDPPQSGVSIEGGRSLTLEGVVIDGALSYGILALEEGTTVVATDTVIRDTRPDASAFTGHAVHLRGADFRGVRVLAEYNTEMGVIATMGGETTLEDSTIRDMQTRPRMDGFGGAGLVADQGAIVSGSRLYFARTRIRALSVAESATLQVADVHVRESEPSRHLGSGDAVVVTSGGHLDAARMYVEDVVGGIALQLDASAELSHVYFRDMNPRERDERGGAPFSLDERCTLTVDHGFAVGGHFMGAVVHVDSSLTLTDVAIRRVDRELGRDLGGYGIGVQVGSELVANRLLVEDVHELGILSFGGSTVHGADVVVRDIGLPACDCPERPVAYGIAAVASHVDLDGFAVSGSELCGLFIAPPSLSGDPGAFESYLVEPSLDVRDGIVDGAEIGACIQVAEYDLARLQDGVVYRDNGTNLDVTMLPVPSFELP